MNEHARPGEPAADGNRRPKKRTMRVLATFYALYGAYCLWWTIQGWYWSGGYSAAMSMATAVGLWRGYSWSRYFVYAFAAMIFAAMIFVYFVASIFTLVEMGWPYQDRAESVAAVVPGSLLLMWAVGAAIYVFRTYCRKS